MLKPGLNLGKFPSFFGTLSKLNLKIALPLISCGVLMGQQPAIARGESLGVIKSQENASQWSEISTRLRTIGIDYCIVDTSTWQDESDFGGVNVLFIPNITNINGSQILALERWVNAGGKIIATGPVGSLSSRQVKDKLKSILGGYWAFSFSSPNTLKPLPNSYLGQQGVSSTFIGGVLLPSTAETAAVWISDNTEPAVINTANTSFFGWRWGVENVAPISLDIAWLRAALNQYGISNYGQLVAEKSTTEAQPCSQDNENFIPPKPETPFLPDIKNQPLPSETPPFNPTEINLNPAPLKQQSKPKRQTTPKYLVDLEKELKQLIARFEITLLTADALSSNHNGKTVEIVEQIIQKAHRKKFISKYSSSPLAGKRTLEQAQNKLKKFQALIAQGRYNAAKWEGRDLKRSLWENYPLSRRIAQPEIRGIWLDRGTIVQAKSERDLAKLFDRFAAAGINTVFFETVNASYPVYPSQVSPAQNPLTKGWDPLAAAVKLAHQRNIELHAWVWIFAAANQRHNLVLNQPANYLGPVLSQRREWATTDKNGNVFHHSSKKAFFDPANPQVQQYLISLLEEIATKYKVDGIQIDYIRYPFQDPLVRQTYGYGKASRRQFQAKTGVDPITLYPGQPLWLEWNKFRIEQVNNFVAQASKKLKQKRPDLILSAAVFPMPQRERLFRLQQHWEEWINQEWIDLLVPMTYAENTAELREITQPLFVNQHKGATLLLPGIRLLNLPDVVAVDQTQLLRSLPTGGYTFFAAENFNQNLQQILSRIQGKKQTIQPLPHRQPFKTAVSRYQNLQKEWNFLLLKQELKMNPANMKEWSKEVDKVNFMLSRLAQEPSMKNFLLAEVALSGLQGKFLTWMKDHSQVKPEQVKSWHNRLQYIDKFLSYGERTMLKSKSQLAEK